MVQTADGSCLARLRGAAQGTAPLLAEIVYAAFLWKRLEPPRPFVPH
jgi:hypothetical protein